MWLGAKAQSVLKKVQPATNRNALHLTPLALEAPRLRIGRVLKGLRHEVNDTFERALVSNKEKTMSKNRTNAHKPLPIWRRNGGRRRQVVKSLGLDCICFRMRSTVERSPANGDLVEDDRRKGANGAPHDAAHAVLNVDGRSYS